MICSKCHLDKSEKDFYGRLDRKGGYQSRCKPCFNSYATEKCRRTKLRAIKFLGGHCVKCGYNKCPAALDYHHIDPSKKDINFVTAKHWSWKRLVEELKKCVLLCANCHREEEYLRSRGLMNKAQHF